MSVDPSSNSTSAVVPARASQISGVSGTQASGATTVTPQASPATPASRDAIAPSTPPTLAVGSQGSAVRSLQKLVGATPDGIYGPKTASAVAAYQHAAGLSVDGIAGPRTWNALTGGEPTLASGSRGPAVASVQKLVGASPDGVYGPKTQAAVTQYQQAHGLRADGVVGPQTWHSLTAGAPGFTNIPHPQQSATQPQPGAAGGARPATAGPSAGGTQTPQAGTRPRTTQPATTPQPHAPQNGGTQPSGTLGASPQSQTATAQGAQPNAAVEDGKEYLTKLGQYFTNPVNVVKQAGSIAGKFGRRDFEALSNAAAANKQFAEKVRSVVDDFDKKPAADVEKSIQGLLDEVKGGKQTFAAPSAVKGAAQQLSDANAVPRAAESLGAKVSSAVDGATSSVRNALENAPGPLRGLGQWASKKLGDAVESVKSSVSDAYSTSSLKQLPQQVKTQAGDAATTLENVATQQTSKASSTLTKTLKAIGTTPDDLSPGGKIPLIGNVPILNLAATGYGIVHDKDKVGTADSVAANVGSMYASQFAGRAVQNALVNGLGSAAETTVGEAGGTALAEGAGSMLAGAATDVAVAGGAELAGDALVGAAVATGPTGWAILAGVGAGIAVGVGVKDLVESKAGQDIINGAFSGNLDQVGKGFGEAGQDVVDLGKGAYHLGEDAVEGAGHLASGAVHEGKKLLDSVGSFLGL